MAAKNKKNIFNKEIHPDTESVVVGSALSIVVALLLKSLLLAIPIGLAIAFAHKHGLGKGKKSRK